MQEAFARGKSRLTRWKHDCNRTLSMFPARDNPPLGSSHRRPNGLTRPAVLFSLPCTRQPEKNQLLGSLLPSFHVSFPWSETAFTDHLATSQSHIWGAPVSNKPHEILRNRPLSGCIRRHRFPKSWGNTWNKPLIILMSVLRHAHCTHDGNRTRRRVYEKYSHKNGKNRVPHHNALQGYCVERPWGSSHSL